MSRGRWVLSQYDKDAAAAVAETCGLAPFAALLLVSRGLSLREAKAFVRPEREPLCDPFLLPDMDRAVSRIQKAVDDFEKIAVFGDYDADGVTSTAILYRYLESRGADVSCHIPDRLTEGYGLTKSAVQALAGQGVRLIVTVDNGISAAEEAEYASSLGVDMVITDHHRQSGVLPGAAAVVDPQRLDCSLPFKDWAGVGVAFKLVCALENGEKEGLFSEFADLVALGTVADAVPLTGENRYLVREGLRYLNNSPRAGIRALRSVAGVRDRELTADGVSYALAPRINAAGRMGSAMTALRLLLCEDDLDAASLAAEVDACNRRRQSVEGEIAKQAVSQLESDPKLRYAPVLVVSGEGWHSGVIGIVAARLSSRYGKPAVVISTEGETGRGSCRSLEGFSVYDALKAVSGTLIQFGGHPLAAGLGIETKRIGEFRAAINAYAETVPLPFPTIRLDCRLNPAYIGGELLKAIALLEPCGAGNPGPCFGLFNMQLASIRPMGEGKHLRLGLRRGGAELQAALFSVRPEQFPYAVGDTVDVAVRIAPNEFRGEIRPSVQIVDLRPAGSDTDRYLKSLRLYERYRYGSALNERELAFLTPDRELLAAIYQVLKRSGAWQSGTDLLCARAGCPPEQAARVLAALDVLCEMRLLERREKGGYGFIRFEKQHRVDLKQSEILNDLHRRRKESHAGPKGGKRKNAG